jgi:hypothetical protein
MPLRRTSGPPSSHGKTIAFGSHNRLRAAAAVLDALCLSALLWLAILAVVR